MFKKRGLLALPLVLAASISSASASAIHDHAGMFSMEAVSQAQAKLEKIERDTQLPTVVETIDSLQGRDIDEVAIEHARKSGIQGLFVLIAKKETGETKTEVRVFKTYRKAFPEARRLAVRDAFIQGFKKRDFDGGLKLGVDEIGTQAAEAKAAMGGTLRAAIPPPAHRGGFPPPARPAPRPDQGSFGLSSLLGIALLVLAVFLGIRLLGSIFGGSRGGYVGRPGMGGPGMGGPGMGGPGYGGPGQGGRGGGFLSSLFGGIGGAFAGNWLYDQFSGRHQHGGGSYDTSHGGSDYGGSEPVDTGANSGGSDWAGAGESSDWVGGSDSGGGGDWGGGGGDWGGGGGDGGGGGGDW